MRSSHRLLSIVLIVPLLIVSLTGLILNHTVDFDLSNRHVTNSWIQSRYGMTLEGEPRAFGLNGKTYAGRWDGQLFYRNQIINDSSALIGAVPLRDGTAIVTSEAVHYFGLDGELIESLDSVTLPASPLKRAGRSQDLTLVLENENDTFVSDRNLLEFTEGESSLEVEWSTPVIPKKEDLQTWKIAFSGDGVPMDRVILDLHSGRLFGSIGKWVYDFVVIGVLMLSASGLVLFFRSRRRTV